MSAEAFQRAKLSTYRESHPTNTTAAALTGFTDDLGRPENTGSIGGRGTDSPAGGGLGPSSSRKLWRTRLRPDWRDQKNKDVTAAATAPSVDGGVEGFICPQCRKKLASPAALLAHFHVLHGGGGGGNGERGSGSGGSSDEGAGVDRRGHARRRGRSSRTSWRGDIISLDVFILALQSFMEDQPHEGYVMARYTPPCLCIPAVFV